MKLLRGLGLAITGTAIAFVICEALLRLFLALVPPPEDSPYVSDPHAAYRLRPTPSELVPDPDCDHINSLGYRDREHPTDKPEGTFRILGIGDSFVYGNVSLDANFLRVAEDSLNAFIARDQVHPTGTRDVKMILAGLGGYAPDNEVGALKSLGPELDPDLVVLNFFVGNDIVGLAMPARVHRGQLYFEGSLNPWMNLARKSRILLLAESVLVHGRHAGALDHTQARGGSSGAPPGGADGSAGPPTVNAMYLQVQKKRMNTYLINPGARMSRLWRRAENCVLEFDRVCRENDLPWVLHVIPAEVQVDPDVAEQVFAGLALEPSRYDLDSPQRRLRELCERNGIVLLDQLALFRRLQGAGERLYIENDTHWNDLGNRVAGEALADLILDHWMAEAATKRLED